MKSNRWKGSPITERIRSLDWRIFSQIKN